MFSFDSSKAVTNRAWGWAQWTVEWMGLDYDEEAFAIRSRVRLESIVEVTRKQLLNSKEAAMRTSGIYLIVHENGQTVYVGLAKDFHLRFTKGIRKHTAECKPGCGHWGHFVVPTTGAKLAGMPDGNCRYFILENIEYEGSGISQAEIDWYYLFAANGWAWDPGASTEKKMTNSSGHLGAKGWAAI